MHTEHLGNVHPMWIASGWLVAVAVTSLIALVLVSLGLPGAAAADTQSEVVWALVALALGFFVGGFSIGYRAIDAPILHGVGIGIASLVAWFPVNVLIDLVFDIGPWEPLTPAVTVTLLLVQMTAAVGGTWLGHRLAETGRSQPGASAAE